METFFRNDKEVQEWIDLFIEKLFTVSLLSGTDADSEFFQGRQAVEKVALFFQEMVDLPEEAVMDGIRQLVEQRLPDSRVIENFPNFYQLMNEMILSGLPSQIAVPVMKTTSQANFTPILKTSSYPVESSSFPSPSSKVVLNGGWTPISSTVDVTIPVSSRQQLLNPPIMQDLDLQVLALEDLNINELDLEINTIIGEKTMNEDIQESTVYSDPHSSTFLSLEEDIQFNQNFAPLAEEAPPSNPKPQTKVEHLPPRRDPFRFNPNKAKETLVTTTPLSPNTQNTRSLIRSTSSKPDNPSIDLYRDVENAALRKSRVVRSAQIPENAEKLTRVFKQVFPNSAIRWNLVIGKNSFYAQVDKVLIYVQESSDLQELVDIQHLKTEMKKEGWSVYVCQKEDLSFPRRLERGLRLMLH